jgi:dTDP-4-dehydrorhamnose reductase
MAEIRYLITGGAGMLAQDVNAALAGRDTTLLTRAQLDITDLAMVRSSVAGYDIIINCAAYTKVDEAEGNEDAAYAVNATGAANLARATAEFGSTLVQISTDYVFDGTARRPYAEDSPRSPVSAYGRTKAAGEELAQELNPEHTYIVRAAWLYGAHGPNFAKTMLRLAAGREQLAVVNDQMGQPTWTLDLAHQIVAMLDANAPAGIYHATNSGQASWFDFARAIFSEAGLDAGRVTPTDSSQFVRPAPRPAYSVLGHDAWRRVGIRPPRDWREALAEAAIQGVLVHK